MEAVKLFVIGVQTCFESTYLRQPTKVDLMKQLVINDTRGFSGMFASINCMHYQWKNCFVAWQGWFEDKDRRISIILEAIVDQSLWIWHAFFGLPRGNNDINVLNRSLLVMDMLRGESMGLKLLCILDIISWQMESTLDGHVLCRWSMSLKVKRGLIL
jgi:hypothetical protein